MKKSTTIPHNGFNKPNLKINGSLKPISGIYAFLIPRKTIYGGLHYFSNILLSIDYLIMSIYRLY
jgi:hypothetical protein